MRHEPGGVGHSDFTELKQVTITINGQSFEHLLYHYRLAYSGWQYVQVIQGGESFVALSEGLQNNTVRIGSRQCWVWQTSGSLPLFHSPCAGVS